MQKYSGEGNRGVQMQLPTRLNGVLARIIEQFQIPWEDGLAAQVRVFVDSIVYDTFLAGGQRLKGGDVIAFIPISGG